jgi:hypothetical protein
VDEDKASKARTLHPHTPGEGGVKNLCKETFNLTCDLDLSTFYHGIREFQRCLELEFISALAGVRDKKSLASNK